MHREFRRGRDCGDASDANTREKFRGVPTDVQSGGTHLNAGGEENVVLRDDADAAAEVVHVVVRDRPPIDFNRTRLRIVQPLQGMKLVRYDRNGLPLHAAR